MTTWTPSIGEAVLYVKPAWTETTWSPYGSGTSRARRPARITHPEQQLIATVLDVTDEGVLIHVEGGMRVLANAATVLPYV